MDAGGAGLLEIVRGIASRVRGEELPEPPRRCSSRSRSRPSTRSCPSSATAPSFFVEGEAVDPVALEAELTKIGDSLLVVGGPGAVKVHVHTDDPGGALALGTARRRDRGGRDREHARPDRASARSASSSPSRGRLAASSRSVAGDGNRRLFESLGAVCRRGRAVDEPVHRRASSPRSRHSRRPRRSCSRTTRTSSSPPSRRSVRAGRPARLVPTRSMQAGLAAMVAFDPTRPAEANARRDGDGGSRACATGGRHARFARRALDGDLAVRRRASSWACSTGSRSAWAR